jgi:hypothetical protein
MSDCTHQNCYRLVHIFKLFDINFARIRIMEVVKCALG